MGRLLAVTTGGMIGAVAVPSVAGPIIGGAYLFSFGLNDPPPPWDTLWRVALAAAAVGGAVSGGVIGWLICKRSKPRASRPA
jgi:MFS family permease